MQEHSFSIHVDYLRWVICDTLNQKLAYTIKIFVKLMKFQTMNNNSQYLYNKFIGWKIYFDVGVWLMQSDTYCHCLYQVTVTWSRATRYTERTAFWIKNGCDRTVWQNSSADFGFGINRYKYTSIMLHLKPSVIMSRFDVFCGPTWTIES